MQTIFSCTMPAAIARNNDENTPYKDADYTPRVGYHKGSRVGYNEHPRVGANRPSRQGAKQTIIN